MCAINGFNFSAPQILEQMNTMTRHRGPDGSASYLRPGISLGHNRLGIIDPSASGKQPMISNDGYLVITFNGEIYNYRELRTQLSSEYDFLTSSDTEVILAAYRKWGRECLQRLSGIFAFAIYDHQKDYLFLARDSIGVKPLYYFYDGERFIFSSEIKGILCHEVPRDLDNEAFAHYLRLAYVPSPLTMFRHVRKLEPGHAAVVKNGNLLIYRYDPPEYQLRQDVLDFSSLTEFVEYEVDQAVKRQSVGQRPYGVYLSGGIDSSIVTDVLARQCVGLTHSFSVGFETANKSDYLKFNGDMNLARKTAEYYGLNHHELVISNRDVRTYFEKSIWHCDEPNSNPTSIPLLRLSEASKQKVDFILGGDGGDELFGGYTRYQLSLRTKLYQSIPPRLRRLAHKYGRFNQLETKEGVGKYALFMFEKNDRLSSVVSKEFIRDSTHSLFDERYFCRNLAGKFLTFEERMMQADISSWLVDHALAIGDRMSMANGVELRVPLLDHRLLSISSRIPQRLKFNHFQSKLILKNAYRRRLPKFLFAQPKRGFFCPSSNWLRDPMVVPMVRDMLSTQYARESNSLFHLPSINRLYSEHLSGKANHRNILWSILTFRNWFHTYKVALG